MAERPDLERIKSVYLGNVACVDSRLNDDRSRVALVLVDYAAALERELAAARNALDMARQLTSEHMPGPCPYCGTPYDEQHWDRCLLGRLAAALAAGDAGGGES